MSEMRDYQEKMVKSKKDITICNWDRGEGKTWCIFKDIIGLGEGRFIYVSNYNHKVLTKYFEEYAHNNEFIYRIMIANDFIKIKYNNKREVVVYLSNSNQINNGLRELKDIDKVYYDEAFPSSEEIDFLKSLGRQGLVPKIYIMMTNDNIEYIEHREDNNNFYDFQIQELMNEYANTPKRENTTMTREKILQQIKMLQDIKGDTVAVRDFNKICIDENDTIVIRVKEKTSDKICKRVVESMQSIFPNNKIIMIPDCVNLDFVNSNK